MLLWADIYNTSGDLVGTVRTLSSASVEKALDDIGSSSFSVPATSPDVDLLQNEYTARLYVEHDDVTRLLGIGVIQKKTLTMSPSGYTLNVNCVGSMKALMRKNVLLGRSYTNTAITTIAAALTALVSGWTITVDSGYGSQTARFDGTSVYKSLLRLAEEKGLHLRDGETANTLELGAFGDDSGITAVAPMHSSNELLANDDIVLIESIVQETDSQDVFNWVVPIGAGEGSAALTLKLASATGAYAINTMIAPDGSTLYYLSDAGSIALYGQNEKIVTFKEIGPVGANSTAAKTYAAQALYNAAVSWLRKNKDPLTTYRMTVRKPRAVLRPGDKINVTFKNYVETVDGEIVPIDLENEPFWIMKVTERVSESGDSVDLQLATVDRYQKDSAKIVVDALEAMQARNVSVQTFPCVFQDSSERVIQGSTSPSDAQYKPATFSLKIPDIFTDIIEVTMTVITRPLYSMTDVGPDNFYGTSAHALDYSFAVYQSTNYPSDITITIDGVDRTVALNGGNLNPSGGNSAVDETFDITDYIINAAGGMYIDHSIVFAAGYKSAETRVNTSHNVQPGNASSGVVECKIHVLGTARATIPAPL